MSVWQVLPELYGGVAELIPIDQAVQARLVQEGMRRERIASNASAAANDSEPTEGRFIRAGRYALLLDPACCVWQGRCLVTVSLIKLNAPAPFDQSAA